MTKRARRVDPVLSAKRAAAGRKGAAARWGHRPLSGVANATATDGTHQQIPVPAAAGQRGTRRPPAGHTDWVRIENRAGASGGTAKVYIYDEIGYWGTTAQEFVDQLNELDVDTIELHIDSPGGDVFPALAIYNALIEHAAQVHAVVDGMAASAASVIAQAGDKVTMSGGSQMMIHDAFGVCVGNADDMEQMCSLLNRISGNLAALYATRTGEGTAADWRDAMKAESWYSAQEAVDAGLADEVAAKSQGKRRGGMDDAEGEAANRWDLSMFKHQGRAEAPAPTIRPAARHAPDAGETIPTSGPGADADPVTGDGQGDTGAAGDGSPPTDDVDLFADLPDDAFAGIAAALDETLADPFELDHDVLRTSITDAYENAPAPPAIPSPSPPPPTAIDIEDFVRGIQEALTL